jgi:hypothetical protein
MPDYAGLRSYTKAGAPALTWVSTTARKPGWTPRAAGGWSARRVEGFEHSLYILSHSFQHGHNWAQFA